MMPLTRKFVKEVFENSIVLNKENGGFLLQNPDTAMLHKDMAYKIAQAFADNVKAFQKPHGEFMAKYVRLQ